MFFRESVLLVFTLVSLIFTEKATDNKGSNSTTAKDENPKKEDQNACRTYKIELVEDDKNLSGILPKDTEIFQEAKANGLVPISTTTIFASPSAVGLTGRLPDSLLKTLKTVETNIGSTGGGGEDGHKFTFLGGVVADIMSDKKDDKKKDNETTEETETPEKPAGDAGAPAGGQPSTTAAETKLKSSSNASKMKANKLLSRKQASLPNLREAASDRDEPSESLLLPREE